MKQQPHTEEQSSNKPLWKVLNEKRTVKKVRISPYSDDAIYLVGEKDSPTEWAIIKVLGQVNGHDLTEMKVNADYTALAVNNLNGIAEALDNVLKMTCQDYIHAKEGSFVPAWFLEAKEALANIS